MIYLGSKRRLASSIVPIIQDYIDKLGIDTYIELFGGGANIIDKVKCKNRIYMDANEDLVCLFNYIKSDLKSNKGKSGQLGHLSSEDGTYIQTEENYPKSILFFDRDNKPIHPTQKPTDLLEYLIKTYTNEGMLVLDNCMGSGSTGVACINANRNFIGIEKEDKYFDIACKRCKEALPMFKQDELKIMK